MDPPPCCPSAEASSLQPSGVTRCRKVGGPIELRIEKFVTVADWAACAITFGWAGTAFCVVHVITRPPPEVQQRRPSDD